MNISGNSISNGTHTATYDTVSKDAVCVVLQNKRACVGHVTLMLPADQASKLLDVIFNRD